MDNSKFYMKTGTRQVLFQERSQLHNARKNLSYIGYFSGSILDCKVFHRKALSFNHRSLIAPHNKGQQKCHSIYWVTCIDRYPPNPRFNMLPLFPNNTQFYLRGQLTSKPQDILVPSHDRVYY